MTAYAIDWEGAYDAWKRSGLPRRRFQYSEQFEPFIRETGMPSEDTVRTRFRSIRDRRGANYVPPAPSNPEVERKPVELDLTEPVKVFRLDELKIQAMVGELAAERVSTKRLRRVVMHLPDGRSVEFESKNAELFALKVLSCMG